MNVNEDAADPEMIENVPGSLAETERRPFCTRKKFIFIIIIFILIILSLLSTLAFFFIQRSNKTDDLLAPENLLHYPKEIIQNDNVPCKIDADNHTEATRTLSSLADFKVDPCNNFYEFACGNFLKTAPKPLHKNTWSSFAWAKNKMYQKLHELLVSEEKETSEAVVKMKKYYRSCLQPLSPHAYSLYEVIKKMGGWALIGMNGYKMGFEELYWKQSSWLLKTALQVAASYNTFPFLKVKKSLETNPPLPTIRMPPLTFKGLLSKDPLAFKAYEKAIISTLSIIKTEGNTKLINMTDDIKIQIKEMWDLETELKKLMTPHKDTAGPITVNEAQPIFEPWLKLTEFLGSYYKSKIEPADKIFLKNYNFFNNLSTVISKTTDRTLSNYVVWSVVRSLTTDVPTQFLSAEAILKNLKRNNVINDDELKVVEPVWEICLGELIDNFEFAIGSSYVRKHVPPSDKADIEKMCENLINLAKRNQPNFFDNETRRNAVKKLSELKCQIAYPSMILDDSQLDEYYEAYKGGSDYLDNFIQHRQFKAHIAAREYGHKIQHWLASPLILNVMIFHLQNQIFMFAGMLHPPLYYSCSPLEMKLGGLGVTLGHELTHSFLPPGNKFNGEGIKEQWWTEKTMKAYEGVEDCYVQEFNGLKMFNKSINGKVSVKENMADSGGLWLAYQALLEGYGGKVKGKKLLEARTDMPMVDLTRAQLFFVSYAQKMCSVYDKNNSARYFLSPYTFNNLRIKGTLINSEEFSKAFNCPAKSTLNPIKKCHVYG